MTTATLDAAVPAKRAGPEERADPGLLPVLPPLAGLLPHGGLRRGATVAVHGSRALLLALLAGPSAAGSWCVVVGMPSLGLVAAVESGVAAERLALVPAPGAAWSGVVAALVDAVDVVVVVPGGPVRGAEARRLAARARQRGAVLVLYGDSPGWAGVDIRLSVAAGWWTGLEHGHGLLHSRVVEVRCEGRGTAVRARSARLWLPAPGGGVAVAPEPVPRPVPSVPARRMPPGGRLAAPERVAVLPLPGRSPGRARSVPPPARLAAALAQVRPASTLPRSTAPPAAPPVASATGGSGHRPQRPGAGVG